MAFGRLGAPPKGWVAVLSAMVGAPIGAADVANLTVGCGPLGAPTAGLRAMVGAGAGGRGGPAAGGAVGTGGAVGGVGGRTAGAPGTVAVGAAGGASAALSVTRTVSFFNGTLEVCLDGCWDCGSLSDIRAGV